MCADVDEVAVDVAHGIETRVGDGRNKSDLGECIV